jgi:hypothetical protein
MVGAPAEYVPEGLPAMLAQAPPMLGRSGATTTVDEPAYQRLD